MTKIIKSIIINSGFLICPSCDGEGEVGYFCGHDTSTYCRMCNGDGVVKSINMQRHSKKCSICDGRNGGCGGCNSHPKGLIEWESYELYS